MLRLSDHIHGGSIHIPAWAKLLPAAHQARKTAASRAGHPTGSQLPSFRDVSQVDGTRWLLLHQPSLDHCPSQKLFWPFTWPCEVMEMSFDLWKTVAVTVLESRHYIGGWFWRISRKKGCLDCATGRLVYLPVSHGRQAVIQEGPAALLWSLWLVDTRGSTGSLSISALW